MRWTAEVLLWSSWVSLVSSSCYEQSPAFPVPSWSNGKTDLAHGFDSIQRNVEGVIAKPQHNAASFSVEITSQTETLWSYYHTARRHNQTRPGDTNIGPNSVYRIASVSKLFTALALLYQHEEGNLRLDDPISKYVPDLEGEIPWSDITLRVLATQLSGLPRDFAQGDLINQLSDPTALGLPPASKKGLPNCDEYIGFAAPCTREDLIARIKEMKPVFAPNQKSTYSDTNFELLGLAIENATDKAFVEYVQEAIFDQLNLSSSSYSAPPDTTAVLPLGDIYWDVQEGIRNPTGGIYSSSGDLAEFLRYILTHYNAIAKGVNWLMPHSPGEGLDSFYGMPFEIFRTPEVFKDIGRTVTFVSKTGGLPGYDSRITIMEEYGLAVVILIGGSASLLSELQEAITVELVRAADEVIWQDITDVYAGSYISTNPLLNSSVELEASSTSGLVINSFVSNGTDVLNNLIADCFGDRSRAWRAQLMPTLLYKNESAQEGEIWRIQGVFNKPQESGGIWDNFCPPDVNVWMYAGLPLSELVFWHEDGILELTAWKLRLKRDDNRSRFILQL